MRRVSDDAALMLEQMIETVVREERAGDERDLIQRIEELGRRDSLENLVLYSVLGAFLASEKEELWGIIGAEGFYDYLADCTVSIAREILALEDGGEEWRPVRFVKYGVDFGLYYECNSDGQIRRIGKHTPLQQENAVKKMRVTLAVGDTVVRVPVSHLIMFTWGTVSQDMFEALGNRVIHHADGDYGNNCIWNLIVCQCSEHAFFHSVIGTRPHKCTDDEVVELYRDGQSITAIATKSDISRVVVRNILRRYGLVS